MNYILGFAGGKTSSPGIGKKKYGTTNLSVNVAVGLSMLQCFASFTRY
jgi:hypothetical protein